MPSSRKKGFARNDILGSSAEDASRLIRENMKCPVCLEVLLPPIYQCETGHNICYLCVDEVSECPLCKSDYGDTRNYFAEELVNSMSFPCKYEEYGCHQTFLGSQLKEHQANCECQPYRCPELACQEVVGIHQMAIHLDKHGFQVMTGDVHQASLEILDDHFDRKTEYNPWRISAFEKEFYTVSTRNRDGTWFFWSYGLGPQKEMKKFSYEILLYSDEKEIMYRGSIQSLRNKPEDIMKNGSCLITTDHLIKSIRKDGHIKCQVFFIQGKNWDSTRKKRAVESKKRLKKERSKKMISNRNSSSYDRRTSSMGPKKSKQQPPFTQSRNGSVPDLTSQMIQSSPGIIAKMTVGTAEEENTFVRRIRESLICPSCQEVITPPVYQCTIGHNVCHKCKLDRVDCILCLSPLTECRNFFAEELLYRTRQRCVHSKHGCQVCLPSAQIKSHEAICDFAPFECPFNVCRQLVCADDLFTHMLSHQINAVQKELKSEVNVPRSYPESAIVNIPNILVVDKIPFYPVIVRESDGSWIIYVITHHYLKYRFELMIKKQSKTLAFQGPVLSLRGKHSDIKLKGNGLILTEKSVKGLKSYDQLNYQIKITKLELPVNSDEGASPLSLPSSWILTPSDETEIVSKTELFANKRTSLSPDDESDYESNPPSTAAINEDDSNSDSEEDTTQTAPNISEASAPSSAISKSETNFHDIESEPDLDFLAGSLPAFDVSKQTSLCMRGTKKPGSQTPQRSLVAMSGGKKGKIKGSTPGKPHSEDKTLGENKTSGIKLAAEKLKSSGTGISSEEKTVEESVVVSKKAPSFEANDPLKSLNSKMELIDSNNNQIAVGKPASLESMNETEKMEQDSNSGKVEPVSILKPTLDRSPKPRDSYSMNNLKSPCYNEDSDKLKLGKRTRSCSKHRVRLSEEVICVGPTDNKERSPCLERVNTEQNNQTFLRSPSKHVLSIEVHAEPPPEPPPEPPANYLNEFGELKRAISNSAVCLDLMGDMNMISSTIGDMNMLSSTSFEDMKHAVMSSSFDVVKSVISLFSPESTQHLESAPPEPEASEGAIEKS